MKKIIAATGNKGKVKEIKEIFSEYEIVSLKEAGISVDVEEDADTFEGNAIKKAEAIAKASGAFCLADDSGIMIDSLNGFPGVKTARWLNGTDREKNLGIIEKLKGMPKEKRVVHCVCAIALAGPNFPTVVEKHVIDGYITEAPRGENGFGFDEIFELENGKTLAELTDEEKNEISARRKALDKAKKHLA